MKFADKLRELREAKGMTREELAAKLDRSIHAVIQWEQGRNTPSLETFQSLCKALGVRCTVFDGCDFGEAEAKPGRGRPRKS